MAKLPVWQPRPPSSVRNAVSVPDKDLFAALYERFLQLKIKLTLMFRKGTGLGSGQHLQKVNTVGAPPVLIRLHPIWLQ